MQPLDLLCVNVAALGGIDTGRADVGMTQNVRQTGKVMVDGVECPGKQMPEVVRKNFFRVDPGRLAERFHITPDVASVQRLAVPRHEDRALRPPLPVQIVCQQAA